MDNEKAEGSLPNKMSHSQIQFSDMSQLDDWNPLTDEEASSPHKEGLYNYGCGWQWYPQCFSKETHDHLLGNYVCEREVRISVLGQKVWINTNNPGPKISRWYLC